MLKVIASVRIPFELGTVLPPNFVGPFQPPASPYDFNHGPNRGLADEIDVGGDESLNHC